jgi:hypothetical protein
MIYEVKLTKCHDGWQAETIVSLGMTETERRAGWQPAERKLSLTTRKYRPGVITSFAHVYVVTDGGVKTWGVYGDYSKRLKPVAVKTATEKSVRAAHEMGVRELETIIAEAKAFYAAKEGKTVEAESIAAG